MMIKMKGDGKRKLDPVEQFNENLMKRSVRGPGNGSKSHLTQITGSPYISIGECMTDEQYNSIFNKRGVSNNG